MRRISQTFCRGMHREDAVFYVGVSPATFDQMVKDGRMSPPKRVGRRTDNVRSHLGYITKVGTNVYSGRYPAIGRCARDLKITKLEFLLFDIYALRPKDPLEVVWAFYFTKAAFCYPGGFEPLTREELGNALAEA